MSTSTLLQLSASVNSLDALINAVLDLEIAVEDDRHAILSAVARFQATHRQLRQARARLEQAASRGGR